MDRAGDRLSVLVARVLPPLEQMLRTSAAMTSEWIERREAWFTGLRGAEDFDLRVPPPELMSYEAAAAAVATASSVAANAIPWSTTPEALDAAVKLSVARSARLLATLCSALIPDPERLTLAGFLAATPPATHPGIKVCKPGGVVALLRKGMKLTRERYLDMRFFPEGWIPLKELRPVERAVVRAVAYRGAVLPPPEHAHEIAATPPCCWVLLELLDPPLELTASARGGRRKKSDGSDGRDSGVRLVSAPLFAGGEITDYIIDWAHYDKTADQPWQKGARIQMLFEDLGGAADASAPGTMPPPPPLPPLPGIPTPIEAGQDNGGDAAGGATPVDARATAAAEPAAEAPPPEAGADLLSPSAALPAAAVPPTSAVGIFTGKDGKEYWLGRVNKVKSGDDPWENTQIIFDSDPHGDEPMWVCPWEVELAPEEYRPQGVPETAQRDGEGEEEEDEVGGRRMREYDWSRV
jgi:hypothetical protein